MINVGTVREGYRLGRLAMLTPYADASEVAPLQQIHRLPGAPAWVAGVINLHGRVVPTLDLALYFGSNTPHPRSPMLLVLGHGAAAAAVIIDDIPLRLHFAAEERAMPESLPGTLAPFVRDAFVRDGDCWLDFDHHRFLAEAVPRELARTTQSTQEEQ